MTGYLTLAAVLALPAVAALVHALLERRRDREAETLRRFRECGHGAGTRRVFYA